MEAKPAPCPSERRYYGFEATLSKTLLPSFLESKSVLLTYLVFYMHVVGLCFSDKFSFFGIFAQLGGVRRFPWSYGSNDRHGGVHSFTLKLTLCQSFLVVEWYARALWRGRGMSKQGVG